jgi:RND family efflux transporter MFP subunit
MPLRLVALLVLAAALGGCGKFMQASGKTAGNAPAQPLLIAAEDVVTVRNSALTSGPAITGTIQPERRADLRAEVQAIVLQVHKENGDSVRKGDLLVNMDTTAIRDALASAEAAERAGKLAFEQAERQHDRMKTLRASGMASAQALDDAEGRRNSAQSDLEASKARLVLARQQLQRTEVRAPFDGVVTER